MPYEGEQVNLFGPDSWCGKTSKEPSAATAEKTLPPSSKKQSASQSRTRPLCLCLKGAGPGADASTMKWVDGPLLGAFTTRSFGASPSVGNESLSSQILEDCPHPKYNLSARACLGVLRRAKRRGKKLPEILDVALKLQICRELFQRAAEREKPPAPFLARYAARIRFELSGEDAPVYCLDGNCIDRDAKQNGLGVSRDVMYTLNTVDRPAVAVTSVHQNQLGEVRMGKVANTLSTNSNASGRNAPSLKAEVNGNNPPAVLVYDARGNGSGAVVPTITGDHENRITDYTALCVGNGQTNNISMAEQANTLDTMHDQQAILCFQNTGRGWWNQTGIAATSRTPCGGDSVKANLVCGVNLVVRRLTPLECDRLQGYPSIRKWDVSKMTKDEYIAWNLAEKHIIADVETGKIYGTRGPGGITYENPKELKGSVTNGYRVVSIRNGATKLSCRVHRVIWIAANGVIPDGFCVDHINGDKSDNRISNLQLLTPEQNSAKAAEDGLYRKGLDSKATKLDPDLKDEIAYLYNFSDFTQRELAEVYGISKSRINQIIKEIGWTDIGEWTDGKGKKHDTSDSNRYKADGNSIALPFWFWLLRRISAQYERSATLGSLFDGIGGFPLCWERCNGPGTALWASEIDEFAIAVTKRHFPDDSGGDTS